MTSTRTTLTTALAGLTLLAALTGCTSAAPENTESAAPTASATVAGQPDNECVDNIAYLQFTDTDTDLSLPDGCETVIVLGDSGTATVGPVKDLAVMGNANTITVESVERVDLSGNDNTITHGGDAPETLGDETTNGTGNTVTAN